MASFNLFTASSTTRDLLSGEYAFISQTGSLATTLDAIDASGSVDIAVMGTLFSSGGRAIDHDGSVLDLNIGQSASIGSGISDSVDSRFTDSVYVSNDGYLYSGSDALDLRASDEGGEIDILNTGTITGKSDGIVTDSGNGETRIINHGEILGVTGGIDHLGGDAFVFNYGSISGEDYGYSGDDASDTVKNAGSITGGVFGEGGADVVLNTGAIDRVELGDGNDIYNGRYGGTIEEIVLGQDGEDKIKGGSEEDSMHGGADDDVLWGRGEDDTIRGGSGRDEIQGQRGDDTLTGGNGGDFFVFAAHGGFDKITDLSGNDKIDLSKLGLKGFKASVKPNIKDAKDGSVIDLAEDYGVTIFVKGVDDSNLGSSDFIL